MKPLPQSNRSLLIRTDFSDESAWQKLRKAVQQTNEEGFQAYFHIVSDSAYENVTAEQLIALAQKSDRITLYVADRAALMHPEQAVLVVDAYEASEQMFRVVPSQIWNVENNLSLANVDYCDFANSCDLKGIFRGF